VIFSLNLSEVEQLGVLVGPITRRSMVQIHPSLYFLKKLVSKMVKLKGIGNRENKTTLDDFVSPENSKILINTPEFAMFVHEVREARDSEKQIILQMGAHVIKTGQSLLLIDLMEKGYITHIALNGAGAIHDYEISLIGGTSEDVESGLKDGSFGMWKETSRINDIINEAAEFDVGYGESVGMNIFDNNPHKDYSILANAYNLSIPATVHISIGTDINHMHPNFSAEAAGKCSGIDFNKYVGSVKKLEGGVIINLGSAVNLPEVFLKALTIARNEGYKVDDFTAANLDQIIHYRPTQNVVDRPKGKGFNIKAKHEESIPTLHRYLLNYR
jgi:hypothetical protein